MQDAIECPSRAVLQAFHAGELSKSSFEEVRAHLEQCPKCRAVLNTFGASQDGWMARLQRPEASAAGFREVAAQLKMAEPPVAKSELPKLAKDEPTLAVFVHRLLDCGLMTPKEYQVFLDGLPAENRPTTARELAQAMHRQDMLSGFQAQAIWQGKTRGLVVGNYVILDRLGKGGMGQVYKARHRRMDRIVALKLLPTNAMKSADLVQRFQREVRAAAKLSHQNIVTAYDADEDQGLHFLVMEYVDGMDLAALVKRHGTLAVSAAVDYVLQAARGLEYAHQHGVIHRDIKPHNLLIDRHRNVKVLDMGLARLEGSIEPSNVPGIAVADDGLTQIGQVMGTLDYMPPEQALDTRLADARADVYSLGCTLYYLLNGHSPYGGDSMARKIAAHRMAPIPSLRTLRSDVPESLDVVFQKMLAKRPEDRQRTMTAVIAELERCHVEDISNAPSLPDASASFLDTMNLEQADLDTASQQLKPAILSESLLRRSLAISERLIAPGRQLLQHMGKRRRISLAVAVGLGLLAVSLFGIVAKSVSTTSGDREMTRAELEPPVPPPTLPLAPPPAIAPFDAKKAKEHQAAWAKHLGVPVETTNSIGIKLVLIPPGEFDMGASDSQFEQLMKDCESHLKSVSDSTLRESYREYYTASTPQHRVVVTRPFYLSVCETTSTQYCAITGDMHTTFFSGSGIPDAPVAILPWEKARDFCTSLSQRPEEKAKGLVYRLPTEAEWEYACRAGTTTRYHSGDSIAELSKYAWFRAPQRLPLCGQKEPNAWGLHDMHGGVWEWCADRFAPDYYKYAPRENPIGPSSGEMHALRGGCCCDEALAICSFTRIGSKPAEDFCVGIRVIADIPSSNTKSLETAADLKVEQGANDPDKQSAESGPQELKTITGHAGEVAYVAFSPDGKTLASASFDRTIKLWDVATSANTATLEGHAEAVHCMAFSPDGGTLASGSFDGTVKLWNVAARTNTATLKGHANWVVSLAFDREGKKLASGSTDSTVKVWDVATGTNSATLQGHGDGVRSVAISPDGKTLASGSFDATVKLWDLATCENLATLNTDIADDCVVFSPDGKTLASGNRDGSIQLWDLASRTKMFTLKEHDKTIECMVFCADGKNLASGSCDRTIKFWDLTAHTCTATINTHTAEVASLALSPDGKTMVSGSYDKTIRFWDVSSCLAPTTRDRAEAVAPERSSGIQARWFGYGLGDEPGRWMPEVAPYTNVVWDNCWCLSDDARVPFEATLKSAQEHGLPVIVEIMGKDSFGKFLTTGMTIAGSYPNAVVGICVSYTETTPLDWSNFCATAKKLLPRAKLLFLAGWNADPSTQPVPDEIDVLVLGIDCTTVEEARRQIKERFPLWSAKSGNRPILLAWTNSGCNCVPQCQPGVYRTLAEFAKSNQLAGFIAAFYGTLHLGDNSLVPINTRPELVQEMRDIGKDWGAGSEERRHQ